MRDLSHALTYATRPCSGNNREVISHVRRCSGIRCPVQIGRKEIICNLIQMVIQMGHGGKVKGPFLNRSVEKGCVCECASVCGGESRNGRNRKKPSRRTRKAKIMINLSGKKKNKK